MQATNWLIRAFSILVLIALCPIQLWAAKQNAAKNANNAVKRERQDVQNAKNHLQDANKQAEAAKSAAQRAHAAHEKAIDHVGDVRRKIEQEHDSNPALVAARQSAEKSKQSFEAISAPILQKLGGQVSYQSAVARRDELKQKLAKLPGGTVGAERESLAKDYQSAVTAVRESEMSAITSDAKAKAAHTEMLDSEAKVRALVEKRNAAIDGDSRLQTAKKDLEKAKDEMERVKAKLAHELKQLADAQRKLGHEQQQERAAEQRAKQVKKKKK